MRRAVEIMNYRQGARAPHVPVLLKEVIDLLQVQPGGTYLDATLGAGGHAHAVASLLKDGMLVGLDKDPAAIDLAAHRLAPFGENVVLRHAAFSDFAGILDELQVDKLDGVLADLGISSMQLDNPHRGFSFQYDTAVDLRLDNTQGESALDLLARLKQRELAAIIRQYGEERYSGRIASAVVEARSQGVAFTGSSLREIIHKAVPAKYRHQGKIDCATRTFQALRIATNRELEELDLFLDRIIDRCNPGARVAVISFHSLEDRMVKRRLRAWADPCNCPKSIPQCVCGARPKVRIITKKAVKAGDAEIADNPRSRSARLRAAEVLGQEVKP